MQLGTRIRLITTTLLLCLMLCVSLIAFSGTATAGTSQVALHNNHQIVHFVAKPKKLKLTVSPHKVKPDIYGCAEIAVDGKNYTASAWVDIQVSTIGHYAWAYTDLSGSFSQSEQICV